MFKSVSYLASVSVLASVVMVHPGYAMEEVVDLVQPPVKSTNKPIGYQDYRGVLEVIDAFYTPPPAGTTVSQVTSQEEVSTSNWLLGVASYACGAVAKTGGDIIRWSGHHIRGESLVGDLLTNEALKAGANAGYTGEYASQLAETMAQNPGIAKSSRLVVGNGMRWVGSLLAGETPTLERVIRQFWIENKYDQKPEEALTNTACAFYLSKHISGVEHINLAYRNFVISWNGSTRTLHTLDPEKNQEYLLKGIAKAYVITQQPINSGFGEEVLALGLDLNKFSVTKAITEDSVMKDNPDIPAGELPKKLKELRLAKLQEYASSVYVMESEKYQLNKKRQERLVSIAETAPATTLASQLSTNVMLLPAPEKTEDESKVEVKRDEKADLDGGQKGVAVDVDVD